MPDLCQAAASGQFDVTGRHACHDRFHDHLQANAWSDGDVAAIPQAALGESGEGN